MTRRAPHAAVIFLAVCLGCSESYTFTPTDPSGLGMRLVELLDRPFVQTQPLAAGRARTARVAALVREGDPPLSFVYIFDWGSAANHVTFTLHREGDAPPLNFAGALTFDCSLPLNGSLIGASLQKPLCPLTTGSTSHDKPKLLEIRDLPQGMYSLVMTNHGPGDETIRWTGTP